MQYLLQNGANDISEVVKIIHRFLYVKNMQILIVRIIQFAQILPACS